MTTYMKYGEKKGRQECKERFFLAVTVCAV
jgi:hypothetical protein